MHLELAGLIDVALDHRICPRVEVLAAHPCASEVGHSVAFSLRVIGNVGETLPGRRIHAAGSPVLDVDRLRLPESLHGDAFSACCDRNIIKLCSSAQSGEESHRRRHRRVGCLIRGGEPNLPREPFIPVRPSAWPGFVTIIHRRKSGHNQCAILLDLEDRTSPCRPLQDRLSILIFSLNGSKGEV